MLVDFNGRAGLGSLTNVAFVFHDSQSTSLQSQAEIVCLFENAIKSYVP